MSLEIILILIVTLALFGIPLWSRLFERFRSSRVQGHDNQDHPSHKLAPRKPGGPNHLDKAA